MVASIPASAIVNVQPAVASIGGSGLDMSGLILTDAARVPIGTVARFTSPLDVAAYFGPLAIETTMAATYFAGYDGSLIKPSQLLFSQYARTAVSGYLRSGRLPLTLAQYQAMAPGTLGVSIDGTVFNTAVNLSLATSFSDMAARIGAAFSQPTRLTVTYDATLGALVVTSLATGATSSVSFATGAFASALRLSGAADGAVISAGADAMTPAVAMAGLVANTQDFVSFTTTFKPSVVDATAFAAWVSVTNSRYLYAMFDDAVAGTPAVTVITGAGYGGTMPIYDPVDGPNKAALFMGAIGSIDFSRTEGRATLAFKSLAGMAPGVTDQGQANALIALGYNFYGAYATANAPFTFAYPGTITGPYKYVDSYINQVWLTNRFQLALMTLLTTVRSIPYNAVGYALIEASLADTIAQGVRFGAIRAGITLSGAQATAIDAVSGGTDASTTLAQRGWHLQVLPASASVRAARGSPPITFWYADGQSIQKIMLNSVEVQ